MKKPNELLRIEDAVSTVSKIDIESILSRMQNREYTDARAVIWYAAHEYLKYSYSYLGRLYIRDHTTIISGVNKIKDSEEYKQKVEQIIKKYCPHILTGNAGPGTIDNWEV